MLQLTRVMRQAPAALALAALVLGLMASITQAFTVWGPKWTNANASYTLDGSYTSQGSGWANSANTAAVDWNGVTSSPFVFGVNANSSNHVQALNIANQCGNCLAWTLKWNNGNDFTQFTIQVNIGSGYAFYDGTQAGQLPTNYYDLASVMRHEFGHALGLCHSNAAGLLMFTNLAQGQVYPVDNDAANGDAFIYNPNYNGPGPTGGCIP